MRKLSHDRTGATSIRRRELELRLGSPRRLSAQPAERAGLGAERVQLLPRRVIHPESHAVGGTEIDDEILGRRAPDGRMGLAGRGGSLLGVSSAGGTSGFDDPESPEVASVETAVSGEQRICPIQGMRPDQEVGHDPIASGATCLAEASP